MIFHFASYMIENQKEKPQGKPKSTPTVIVIIAHSTSFSVHESASWLCSLFLFHLLSSSSSDRSHNEQKAMLVAITGWVYKREGATAL